MSEKELKLVSTISTSNMCLFNSECIIHKYNNINEIIHEFYNTRLRLYTSRKQYLLSKMKLDIEILNQKMLFILGIINEEIIINKRSKNDIIKQLEDKKFKKMDTQNTFNDDGSYNYLINMPIYSLTLEKKIELETDYKNKEIEFNKLESVSVKEIWLSELEDFESNYEKYMKEKDNKYISDKKIKIIKKRKK